MKKATNKVTELQIKPRKGLKLFSALAMVLPAFVESGEKTFAIVHVNKAPKTSFVIRHSKEEHMATVSTPSGSQRIHDGWHASIAGKSSRVYCLAPMKFSPGKHLTAYKSGHASADVRAVLRAGYGLNTAAELGHPGQEAACEYGTQVAVWRVAGLISPKIGWHNKVAHSVYNHIMRVYKQKKYRGDGLTRMYIKDLDRSTNSSTKKAAPKKTGKKATPKKSVPKKVAKPAKKATAKKSVKKAAPKKKAPKKTTKKGKKRVAAVIALPTLHVNAAKKKAAPKKTVKGKKTPVTTARSKDLEVVTTENGKPISLNINVSSSNISITQHGKAVKTVKSNTPFKATLKKGANTGSIHVTTTAYSTEADVYTPRNGTQQGVSLIAVKNKKLSDSYRWNQPLVNHHTVGTGDDYEVVPQYPTPDTDVPAPDTPVESETPKTSTPSANTKLTNTADGKQVIQQSKGSVTLNESVSMSGLKSGEKYKVNSWLVDESTGKPALVKGKQISGNTEYTANGETGTVSVKLTVPDVSGFTGKKLVAFTDVNQVGNTGDSTIKHENLHDEDETVTFTKPSIHTTATGDNGSKVIAPSEGVKITDKVDYQGLVPGEKYTVKGVLMSKNDNKAVTVKGQQVTGTATFTAKEANGSVDVPFNLDASSLRGKRLVVFETLYSGNSEIAEHKDINDVGQSVDVSAPELHTTLTANSQKVVAPSETNIVQDQVRYQGASVGSNYEIRGTLMDKTTGLPVTYKGEAVHATANFKATKANGSITLPFKFDGTKYVGHQLVAYEDMYLNNKEVAKHEVLGDTAQTVLVQHKHAAPLKTPASGNTAPSKSETVLPTTGDTQDNILLLLVSMGMVITVLGVVFVHRNQASGVN